MSTNDDPDPDASHIWSQLLIILILTLINAFFAASEMALISANKVKIDVLAEKKNKKAIAVQKLSMDQTNFLSTIQVGITLAGFFSSATAASSLSDDLGLWLESLGLRYGSTIALISITIILSFFTLIFGELFPKKIALAFPEKVSMWVAGPITVIKIIFTPFVKFLSGTCNLLVKITGLNKHKQDEKISEEEIINVIETGVSDGTLDLQKQQMIESVLKFNDLTATDIMTPRVKTYMIDIEDNITQNLKEILDEKYTRIPVYEKTQDHIIGILNVKDLLEKLALDLINKSNKSTIKLRSLLREPLFLMEKIKINKAFQKMKDSQNQIAILLDEFGGVTGIITMEDIIEEVMGNIYDEYDDEVNVVKINENEYLVSGNIPIQEINRELDLEFDEDNENYDTLAGYIINTCDGIPKEKEKIDLNEQNITLIIEKASKKRIEKVKIMRETSKDIKEN